MYIVKYARRGTDDYNQTLKIRNEAIFAPNNSNIEDFDLSCEEQQIVIGAFETNSIYNNLIIGTAVLGWVEENVFKVEYVCADTVLRKKGIGTSLMRCMEKLAADRGAKKLCLDAPVDTIDFFQRFGYMQKGEMFAKAPYTKPCVTMVKPVFSMPKTENSSGCSCGHDHHGHTHHHSHEHHNHGHSHHGDCGCEK